MHEDELESNSNLDKIVHCVCINQKLILPTSIEHNRISTSNLEESNRRNVPSRSPNLLTITIINRKIMGMYHLYHTPLV